MTIKNDNTNECPLTIIEKIVSSSGQTILKTYNKGKLLGKGGFARVYELFCVETGQVYAGKFVSKDQITKPRARHKLLSEIKIHRMLIHQNIVKFDHFFENDEYIFIILELCRHQSLSDLIRRRKRLSELEVQCYLIQIIEGLKYMHAHRIIHRDIKLGNIFLTEKMEAKIGDLGLAAKLEYEGERKRTICGTPNYIAPEILDGKIGHSYECDVWSFGVLMYTLLVGRPPFETKDVKMTYRRIKMNLYVFPESVTISDEAKSLIISILVVDHTKRPTFDSILSHDFFRKNLIPKFLPLSTLAVPPTQTYIKQFSNNKDLENDKIGVRASSQESQKDLGEVKSPRKRNFSKENKKEPNKNQPCESAYKEIDQNGPDIWVKKWVDYSSKYGLGYLLSNNSVGVVFNDSTRIILNPTGDTLQYVANTQLGETISIYNLSEYPKEIHKKIMLLHLFKKQLFNNEIVGLSVNTPFCHLKKWINTPHAIIFRLTNKVIQVFFKDYTELLLCSEKKHIAFVNKDKETRAYPLVSAMDSGDKQMIKRLKYSKEVLTNMLKGSG